MAGKYIIVEKDVELKDFRVFTGQIQIVDSRLVIPEYGPLQVMDGVGSPDIEHAFLFNTGWDAWRFAMQFQPIWDQQLLKFWGFRRWVARKDGDYFPGECRQGVDAPNPIQHGKSWIPQEALIAATAEGFQQGHASARREMTVPS
jgi:hypothetical protein